VSRPQGYWQQPPGQLSLGVSGNLLTILLSAVVRLLLAKYRSRRDRTEFVRELERRSGTHGLRASGLPDAFSHTQFADLLVTGNLAIAKVVVSPMIPRDALDADVANIAAAFAELCREVSDPLVKAIRASHDSITEGVGALADRGIGSGDPQIRSILSDLEDHDVLPDRGIELALLEQLLREPGAYEAIVAPAYTGKSTLLAFFAAHPPPGVDVVSFFVVRRIGQNTINRFLDVVNGQLRHLVEAPGPEVSDTDRRVYYFEQLWAKAVENATMASPPRRLLLLVDGLDEQEDAMPGAAISSLLPAPISEHVTVVVSSRPNPSNFVLRSNRHPLVEALAYPWRLEPTKPRSTDRLGGGVDFAGSRG
jgi:hypothetical protein